MSDINGFLIEYGDGVTDVRYGTRGYAREQNGGCLIIWNGKALTRIPLCRVMIIWKPIR